MYFDLGNVLYITTGIGLHTHLRDIALLASHAVQSRVEVDQLWQLGVALREVLTTLHPDLPDYNGFFKAYEDNLDKAGADEGADQGAAANPVEAFAFWVAKAGAVIRLHKDFAGSIKYDTRTDSFHTKWEAPSTGRILRAAKRGGTRRIVALAR